MSLRKSWLSIRRQRMRRKVRHESAGWHTRIGRRLTITQRRAFELWIADPVNAREFNAQRYLLDVTLKLNGAGATRASIRTSSPAQAKLAKPPAIRFVSALRWLLTEQAYARIVAPLVAQEQHAYYECLRCGDIKRAYWVELRMYILVSYGIVLALLASVTKVFRSLS
jgi:hypothetical protein